MRRRSPLISAALVIAMPTIADWAAEEQRLLWLRGVRVIAADAAAREAAKHRPPPDPSQPQLTFEMGPRRLTQRQVQEAAAAYRRNYANCDEELRNLMEARLVAALTADGYAIPPMPAADRLRELKARQLR